MKSGGGVGKHHPLPFVNRQKYPNRDNAKGQGFLASKGPRKCLVSTILISYTRFRSYLSNSQLNSKIFTNLDLKFLG